MPTQTVFEECIQFVSQLEGRPSELDLAKQMGTQLEASDLDLLVIQKLKRAIEMLQDKEPSSQQSQLLYHLAQYANVVGKPRLAIPLCFIVINQPASTQRYQELARDLLVEIKLKLPADMYNDELQKTTLNAQAALRKSQDWLTNQEKHASQPPTKHVFNSDLLKKYQDKGAEN